MNDITVAISSHVRFFADDYVLYRVIQNMSDCVALPDDLNRIAVWCKKWGMRINLQKTVHLCFSKKRTPHQVKYTINSEHLSCVPELKYLGVFFTSTLTWHRHIEYISAKACRVLGFLRRNTKHYPFQTKQLLYIMNVRSILEYACTVWDPWLKNDVQKLERVQNIAVRFVFRNYTRNFSVSRAKEIVGWEPLEERRRAFRLKLFHNIFHSRTGIDREKYFFRPDYVSLRLDHVNKVREMKCKTDVLRKSFFPRTISNWNLLPRDTVTVISNDAFFSML